VSVAPLRERASAAAGFTGGRRVSAEFVFVQERMATRAEVQ